MVTKRNPAPQAAGRASEAFCVVAERSEDTQATSYFQPTTFCVAALAFDARMKRAAGAYAIAFSEHPEAITATELPGRGDCVDEAILADRLAQMRPDVAVTIDVVASGDLESPVARCRRVCAHRTVVGVLAALEIPVRFVAPVDWKHFFDLSPDKDRTRAKALQLWPARRDLFGRRRHRARAEAALAARYLAERIVNEGGAQ